MDFKKLGGKVAAKPAGPPQGPKLQSWSVIQHDGKGNVITVTADVSAPSAEEAIALVKDMSRRGGGPFGKAVAIKSGDVKRITEGY